MDCASESIARSASGAFDAASQGMYTCIAAKMAWLSATSENSQCADRTAAFMRVPARGAARWVSDAD